MRTYPFATSLYINAVDLRTLGGVADPSKNRCLPRVCSSNNEDSELDVLGESGEILLCSHSVEMREDQRLARDLKKREIITDW
jgi:hypothetical protein